VHGDRGRRQPFVQVGYRVVADGKVVPDVPPCCPAGEGGRRCRVRVHARRERSQGPPHALVVARCDEHGCSFTLYPPGWVPYGRRPLCEVSPEGYSVRSQSREGTLFAAAEDAAAGLLWPRSGAQTDQAVQRTQGRHLECASLLLAVHGGLDERIREAMAPVLGVPLLALHEASRSYAEARTWHARGHCLMGVLRKVGAQGQRPALWSRAGHTAGLWGRPSRWDPGGAERSARAG